MLKKTKSQKKAIFPYIFCCELQKKHYWQKKIVKIFGPGMSPIFGPENGLSLVNGSV